MTISANVRTDMAAFMADFKRASSQRIEIAMLNATDRMARDVLNETRRQMTAAGLGTLGNALGAGSDLKKYGRAHRIGANGLSASGWVFIRSGSERSRGAIDVYLGSGSTTITPKKGRYLWFPTDEIQRLVGKGSNRRRVTPKTYREAGLEQRIGPLVQVKAANGNPVLIVRNVGVSASGKPRSARALKRNGMPRSGQEAREFIVAFIGIPYTSRQARVNIIEIARSVTSRAPEYFQRGLGLS